MPPQTPQAAERGALGRACPKPQRPLVPAGPLPLRASPKHQHPTASYPEGQVLRDLYGTEPFLPTLPRVSNQQHWFTEFQCPSHQHRQSPHALGPHDVAELRLPGGCRSRQFTYQGQSTHVGSNMSTTQIHFPWDMMAYSLSNLRTFSLEKSDWGHNFFLKCFSRTSWITTTSSCFLTRPARSIKPWGEKKELLSVNTKERWDYGALAAVKRKPEDLLWKQRDPTATNCSLHQMTSRWI